MMGEVDFEGVTIVLRIGGAANIEIYDAEGARDAIRQLSLRRETRVTVWSGSTSRELRADQTPQLEPLFDDILGPLPGTAAAVEPNPVKLQPELTIGETESKETPIEALSAGTVVVREREYLAVPAGQEKRSLTFAASDACEGTESQHPNGLLESNVANERPDRKARFKLITMLVGVAVTGVFASLIFIKGWQPHIDPVVTVYTRNDVNIRTTPYKLPANVISQLKGRGNKLEGTWEMGQNGQRWLHIVNGTFAGSYVWSGGVSTDPNAPSR